MPHCVFIAPPFAGHLNPLGALAQALRLRGHRTTFLHLPAVRPLLPPGLDFVPLPAPDGAATLIARLDGAIAAARPGSLGGLLAILRLLGAVTEALCAGAPPLLRALGADLVVADQAEAAGGLIARHLNLPYVSIACALPIDEAPEVPPPFTGWAVDTSWRGRWRNCRGYDVSRLVSAPLNRCIARRARAWGLGALRTLPDCLSPAPGISQMVASLDVARPAPSLRYVGPLRPQQPPGGFTPPPYPFAFVSLGTLQGGRLEVLRAIAAACAAAGLGAVIAHGGRLPPADLALFPPQTVLHDFVAQGEVLPAAALAVVHGGMNTVLDALAAGVPMVLVPLAFEQPGLAMRVARAGAGLVVPTRQSPRRLHAALAAAIGAVHGAPRFRAAAAALAREIAASGGADLAARLVEQCLPRPTYGASDAGRS